MWQYCLIYDRAGPDPSNIKSKLPVGSDQVGFREIE